jgi:hypothetical protein
MVEEDTENNNDKFINWFIEMIINNNDLPLDNLRIYYHI